MRSKKSEQLNFSEKSFGAVEKGVVHSDEVFATHAAELNSCSDMSENRAFVSTKDVEHSSENNVRAEKKLAILVDGSSFVYRAFYALPQLTGKDGAPIGAVFGFCSMLLSLMDKHKSDLFCVALDAGRETFRKQIYSEYKSNRAETPIELKSQFPVLIQACESFGVPMVEVFGYEADDIIATLATKLSKQNYEVRIIASDKDLMQLIDDNIYLFDPIKSKVIKSGEVFEKYRVLPAQMVALQALMGDSSDNVPGVRGIGPKTAAQLINDFGSISNIYENIEKVRPEKIREKLKEQKGQLLMSKKLVELCREVPLDCDFSQLKVNFDPNKAKNFLETNGFNALVKRVERQSVRRKQRRFVNVVTADDLKNFMELGRVKKFSIFSTGCFNGNQILAICSESQIAGCFFTNQIQVGKNILHQEDILVALKPYLTDESIVKIGLRSCYKLFPEMKSFDDLTAVRYLLNGVIGNKISDLFPENNSYICKFTVEEICNTEQSCLLAELMFDEHENLIQELKRNNLLDVYLKIDMPLFPVLRSMEQHGILISDTKLKEVAKVLEEKIAKIESQIFELTGYKFNIGSSKQLSDLLFEKLKLPRPKKKTSLDVETLEEMYELSPIPKMVVEWRHMSRLLSNYTYSLCDQLNPKTHRLHTTFHASSTVTGRLSSSNPNLQNIPYRSELGKEIRRAFISPPGFKLISFDYSQIELRVLAHMAGIKLLQEAFSRDLDVHKATASQIFNVSIEDVTPEMRSSAKTVNFGIIYGMSPQRLSRRLNIPLQDAKDYIENYFRKFPEFVTFKEEVLEFARRNGYVKTITGRHCYIKDIFSQNYMLRQFSERQAVNAVIQGTAADIVKVAMINIYPRTKELHSSMIVQIHDELVFEAENEYVDKNISVIKEIMEQSYQISVPLKVNAEYNDHLN